MPLSNSTATLLRTQYYDDWYTQSNTDPSITRGEEFDFHRILFRPRFPVQSRELTQLQTLLQVQLERLGKSEFRDGEAVFGGQLTLDTSVLSGQVLPASNLVAMFNRTTNEGRYIFDTTTQTIKGHVLQFVSADEGETSNNYLVFKQQSGDGFLPGAVVQAANDASVTATFASGSVNDIFQSASIVSIDEGVFFVSGFFVRIAKQTIVLNPFSNRPSYRIGLQVDEQVLDELDDVVGTTLLDPANQNAPGAHRFRIKLTLAKKSLATSADAGFIELARVIDGVLQQSRIPQNFVRLDELLDLLARRTYDEAGDYIVKPFTPVIQTNPNDEATFILSLGPGKAYAKGYEVQTSEPTPLVVRKGRDTNDANNRTIPLPVGNFVYVTRVAATQPVNYFANTATVDLHCVNIASIVTTSGTTYNYSRIGQAKLRMLETFDVPTDPSIQANTSIYRLYFYDVVGDTLTGNVVSAAVNNSVAITLTMAIGNGLPAVNNAIEGVTILLSGAASPVTGTFTVNNYVTANATHAWVTLKEFLPTLPNGNTQYQLLFQLKDIDSFALYDAAITPMTAPYAAKFDFQADVDPVQGKTSGTPIGPTQVLDTNDNVLLYQIPEKFVKANTITTNSAIFTSWLKTTANARAFGSASNLQFTLTVSGANYSLPTGSLSATTAQEFLIVFDQTVDTDGNGRIVQFTDTANSTNKCITDVSIAAVGSDYNITFTYHFGTTTATTRSIIALAKTTVTGLPVRTKTLVLGNTTVALASTTGALNAGQIEFYALNATAGFAYSLKTTDVFRIKKVLYKASNTAFSNTDMSTATDVTSLFALDTGQRDNTYEYSRLIVGATASGTIQPTGRLLVVFDWFKNSGQGYASLDSYLSSVNLDNGMTYDIIPSYTSTKFNLTVNLRDVLDFRPMRSNFDYLSAALVFAANDTAANNTYLTSTATAYLIPVSDGVWLGSYEYFLSRIDKIGLAYDGTFKVIEGLDDVAPKPPQNDNSVLLLFQLNIPSYTLVDANGKPTTVLLTTFDHKRYTMQDLSKLDDRVAHLEYYTALNSLEQITKNTPVLDSDDNERFKNGIVVDNFHSGGTADMARPDFTASIDTVNGELRSAFRTFVVQFAPDVANSTSVGVTLIGDMAIPSYNTAPLITQPLATHAISVNPFDVASFYGTVALCPAVDTWKAVETKPAQVIDLGGPSESWTKGDLPSFVNWGEWEQTWSGTVASAPRQQFYTPPGWTPDDHPFRSMTELSWNDVTTATNYERQGTSYEFAMTSTTTSLGNRVVDVSVVHNIRKRDVVFAADGLKPKTNLHAFFDGQDVTKYIQQADVLELAEASFAASPFYIGQTVYVQKQLTGNVAVTTGNTTITGNGSKWQYELVVGQLIRITQGVNTFDTYVNGITSNTSASITVTPAMTLATAVISTLTPVTVAQVAPRITGNTVTYTVKVARALRDADNDQVVPYPITAGCLRPDKMVNDAANTTTGAALLIPASPRQGANSFTITSAVCPSGVVRAWDSGTATLRFDTDITDTLVSTIGTPIHFVGGPGAGQSANVVSYTSANQTAVLDNSALTITPGQTIYSAGTVATDGFLANASVTSGQAGTVAGVFHLPDAAFAVGSRLFRLTDEPTNNVQNATTAAEKNYDASGMAVQQQDVSVTSRSLDLRRGGPKTETLQLRSTSIQNFQQQYIDPLAETFLIDASIYPLGVFITSVDLCFASVPDDDIPVILEIRPVVNGYPSSNEIVPCVASQGFATASLRPDAVKTSAAPSLDSSDTVTTFTLPAPVQLLPGTEYALVVRSDSDAYKVYTAELGASVIGSDAKVAKQPYAGSFFKSQNASTWTESPLEDLMFRINRAVWTGTTDIPQTGILVARGVAPDANASFDSYEFYPHDVQFGDATGADYSLDIKPMNLVTGDLTGQVAVRYDTLPSQWSLLAARSMLQGFGGSDAANNVTGRTYPFNGPSLPAANTVDGIFTLSTTSTDVAPFIDIKKTNLLCVRHLINDMSLDPSGIIVTNPGGGYLATLQSGLLTTTATSTVVTGDANTDFTLHLTAGDTLIVGGNVEVIVASVTNSSQIVATANVGATRSANTFWTYGDKGANNAVTLTVTDGNGTDAAGYTTIGRNGKATGVVFSANGSGYTGTPTLTVPVPSAVAGFDATLQSNASLSYASELGSSGGNSLTRYLTRSVTLADGFEARDLTVTFDAYRPVGSHFYVYYKVLPGDADTQRFDDQPWRLMAQTTDDSVVSTGYYQYKEFNFATPNNRALDAATDTTDRFKIFAIKVLLASTGTVDVPRIANFRAIALDT